MKQAEKLVGLVISSIDDVRPFPQDDAALVRGKIKLCVWMTEEHIRLNIKALNELLKEKKKKKILPKIRQVK